MRNFAHVSVKKSKLLEEKRRKSFHEVRTIIRIMGENNDISKLWANWASS